MLRENRPAIAVSALRQLSGQRASDRVDDCVAELRALGYPRSAIIGTVQAQGNQLEPVTIHV